MLVTSHIGTTLLLTEALSLQGAPEIGVAFVGGVLLDLDHLIVNRKWLSDIRMFFRGTVTHGEVSQHSWMQEPVFGLLTGVIIGFVFTMIFPVRWWIFPLFQAIHISMDALMRYAHQPLAPLSHWVYRGLMPSNTKTELGTSLILPGILWLLFFS